MLIYEIQDMENEKLIVFFWPECYLCGDEELLHGHHVHVGEVLDHEPLALVQVVVTSTL